MTMRRLKRKFKFNPKKSFLLMTLFFAIVGLTIGYAFLTTSVSIEGVSKMSEVRWDVHFNNIVPVTGSVTPTTAATITNPTTITFGAQLENPGDFYKFNVDIVNAGTLDAKIDSFEFLPVLTTEQAQYFDYTVTYADGAVVQTGDALDAGDTETLLISFTYKILQDESLYPIEDVSFTFSLEMNYVQGKGSAIVHPDFSNMSWDDLANNPSVIDVGDTKEVDLGSLGTHTIRVVNNSQGPCDYESKTTCGIVLEFVDIINTSQIMYSSNTNAGGWESSSIRSYLYSTVYDALPSDLQQYVMSTTVVSGHGSTSGESNFVTDDYLYLLSPKELGVSYTLDSAASSTGVLEYYSTHTGSANLIKKYGETNTSYWTRTAVSNSNTYYRVVSNTGTFNNQYATTTGIGIAPAFRISFDEA